MIRLSTRHVSRSVLRGPAERVVIEVWLSGLSGLMLNGYPDGGYREVRAVGPEAPLEHLAPVEVLAYRRRRLPTRTQKRAA